MREFFASLRRLLALHPKKVVVGDAVIDRIENRYIPAMEKLIREEENPAEREHLEESLALWRNSVKGTERGKWNEAAAIVVTSVIKKYPSMTDADAEEIAQSIAQGFYSEPRMIRLFDKFDKSVGGTREDVKRGLLQGPASLMKLFKSVVSNEALYRARRYWTNVLKRQAPLTTDEGDLLETIEAPTEGLTPDWDSMVRHLSKLRKYVDSKVRADPLAKAVWEKFLPLALKKGNADRVKMRTEVYPEVAEQTGASHSALDRAYQRLRGYMREFEEEVKGRRMTERAMNPRSWKRKSSSASMADIAEAIARDEWEVRFATWILGG